jgi:hypothetical protein
MRFPAMNAFSKALFAGTIAATFAGLADAALARYLDPTQVDLVRILAPPPTPQSPEGKAELEAVLTVQRTRTDAEVKQAQADDELSVFRYADVMGAGFAPENLPFTTAFFKDVAADGGKVVNPTRQHFKRQRPVADHIPRAPRLLPMWRASFSPTWFPKRRRRSSPAPPTGAVTASSPACTTRATSKRGASRVP